MKVYVFKTSVRQQDINNVGDIINLLVPDALRNFDLDDCDNILRVESNYDIVKEVCSELAKFGFFCQELQ